MKRFSHFAAVAVMAAATGLYADDRPAAPAPAPDARRGDAPAPDAKRGEAPAPDARRGDAPAPDAKRGEAPAPDARRGDAPAPDARRGDAPAPDAKRGDAPAPDARRGEAPARADRGDQPRGERGGRGDERRRDQSTAASYIEAMDPVVSLTADQKKAIPAIFETRDKAIKDFETENADKIKAASKAMEDAIQGNDREAVGKARQEYRDIFGPMHEIMRKASDDLENLLTPEQKTKVAESRVIRSIQGFVAPVQLTEEQLKKLVPIASAPSENVRESLQDKIGPALEQVLTPEQKAMLAKRQAMGQLQRSLSVARLSREQMTQIDAAYDELAKDAGANKEELVKKLTEKVNGILTDEQKEAIKIASQPRAGGDAPRRER